MPEETEPACIYCGSTDLFPKGKVFKSNMGQMHECQSCGRDFILNEAATPTVLALLDNGSGPISVEPLEEVPSVEVGDSPFDMIEG